MIQHDDARIIVEGGLTARANDLRTRRNKSCGQRSEDQNV